MADLDPRMDAADVPADITTPSTYTVVLHEQMGPALSDTDVAFAAGELEWDGREESPPPTDSPNVAYCTCTTMARWPDLTVVAGATFEFLPVNLSGDRPKTTHVGGGWLRAGLPAP